jgi:hypothetical protein
MEKDMKLSYMKIGTREFHLSVGDKFFTNGHCFSYTPISEDNRKLLPYGTWHRRDSIEITKKYKDAILANKFSNIEIIKKEDRYVTYRITEVEEVILPKNDFGELWYIGIGIKSNGLSHDNRKTLFNYETSKIKNRTDKQIKLETDLNYRSVYNTEETLDIVFGKGFYSTDRLKGNDEFGVFIEVTENDTEEKFEKIEKFKDLLYQTLKTKLTNELNKAKSNLEKLDILSKESGF